MACTPDEIEEKRRQALRKLEERKSQNPNLNAPTSVSPLKKFFFKSQQTSFKHDAKPYERPQVLPFHGKDKVVNGKCSLISEDRFVVELSEFSAPAIEVFKTMPTRRYNVETRQWDFNIKDHQQLMNKLQALQPNVVVEKLPKFALSCVNKPVRDYSMIDLNRLEPELANTLMPFQEEGVRFGIDKNGRCLIADDMGLGKTFQALGIAHYYVENWPLLVVTTSSMKNTWEETIYKFLPSISPLEIQYMTTAKDYIGDSKVLIVSYDMMSRALDKLLARNFGVIIIDESHTLKNSKAKCTQSAKKLSKLARRVILLSGTPALSRPCELFTQLQLVDDKFFGSYYDYTKRYCDGKQTNFGWDATGKSNLQELEVILYRRFMIRRTKDDVLKTLPRKTQEIVTLDVNLDQFSQEDRECLNQIAMRYQDQKKGVDKHALLLTFFSETAKIKIPSVCSYILQVLETKQKFLLFAHHQIMLDAVCDILKKKDVKFIRIDGNTTSEQRKFFVDKFQLNEDCMVAVLSITAANAGITLTAAQLVIFAELHWNPSILSQAESRAHRIGQTSSVIVKYLLAPGTADDSIWPMLQEKQKILGEVGLSKETYENVSITKQTKESLERLTEDLNFSFSSRTEANTLDISSYFKTPTKNNLSLDESIFNDGLDDILSNINV